MKKTIPALLILLLFFSGYLSAGESLVGENAPQISGKKARGSGLLNLKRLMKELERKKNPDGSYKEVNGKFVWNFKKNVVVLNFFSTSCIPCIKEIPSYNRIAKRFAGKDVKLIYVNVDTEVSDPQIRRFIIRRNIQVPMMMPNQRDVIRKYQVYTLPRIVVIDREQKISEVIVGFHKDLEQRLVKIIETLLTR